MLRVNIAALADGAIDVDLDIPPTHACLNGLAFELDGRVSLVARLSVAGRGEYFLRGTLEARTELECRRCLAPVSTEITVQLDILFAEQDESGDPSIYLIPRHAGELDLSRMVREELTIASPQLAVCSDDCRGLCSRCGVNLNTGRCACRGEADARWAKLEELKNTLTE